ncbi:MAG: histidinol-phosphate transaminase [Ruminococcus sp.]|nr:histidinol-phosphate transaminase [Ruminococcus sp.]
MEKWEEYVRRVVPYTPGEQPKETDVIKLNTNENPYPPCEGAKKLLENYNSDDLKLYPDPACTELVDAIAKVQNVKSENVFVGIGSDDVLSMAFLTFFGSDKPILFPDITYSFYDVWADVYNIPYKTKPLDESFEIKNEDYLEPNGGIVFPNPNAPTGVYKETQEIEEIIKANKDSVVIIDEAYIDFGGQSCVPLINKYDNLLVVQTFSKSRSMAGVRIGYAIGSEQLIKYMSDVKFSINSYTLNRLSLKLGVLALEDTDYFNKTTQKIISTREKTKLQLESLGFNCLESKSNFIFASHKSVSAARIFEKLKKRRIFVRYWNKPRIDNHLRITIGTDEQMEKLICALEEIVACED